MKRLILSLAIAAITTTMWGHSPDRDILSHSEPMPEFPIPQTTSEHPRLAPETISPVSATPLRTPSRVIDDGTWGADLEGFVDSDKLAYYIYRLYSGKLVAFLAGWVDSYDYYPHITVPDYVTYAGQSVPVTRIATEAFAGGYGITGVTFGKNVNIIMPNAFLGCSIAELSIPSSVVYILEQAFYNCTSLTKVTFEDPASIENHLVISRYAFAYTGIKTIEIPARLYIDNPNSFAYIYANPFASCISLESITINPNFTAINRNYTLELNQSALCIRKTDDNGVERLNIVAYPAANAQSDVNFSGEFIDVWKYAFSDVKVKNVTLTSTLAPREGKVNFNLDYGAFYYSDISSLNINANGPIQLGSRFSEGCRFLPAYNLSDNITNYKALDGILYAKKNGERYLVAYPCGRTDDAFTLPSDAIHIADYGFNCNPYIKEVTLPLNFKTIGNYAFRNCPNLARIICSGNSIASIGLGAFNSTKVITSAPAGEVTLGNCLIGYKGTIPADLVISDGISSAADGIFASTYAINSVTFPKNFPHIPAQMFYNCPNLHYIRFPENLRTIGRAAFFGAGLSNGLTTQMSRAASDAFVIPEGVTTIESGAFESSFIPSGQLSLPSTLSFINDFAFDTGNRLLEVEIHRATPPEFGGYDYVMIFNQETLDNATLIIPSDADPVSFSQSPQWNFASIVRGDFTALTEIESDCNDALTVTPSGIASQDGTSFNLYGTDGRLIGVASSFSGLVPGMYIARTATSAQKFVIR